MPDVRTPAGEAQGAPPEKEDARGEAGVQSNSGSTGHGTEGSALEPATRAARYGHHEESVEARREALRPLFEALAHDRHWVDGKSGPRAVDEAATLVHLSEHAAGNRILGLSMIPRGESVTRAAVLDLDSHRNECPPEEMKATARRLVAALHAKRLYALAWTSSSGRGIHLWIMWAEPQDAFSVRQLLRDVLAECGLVDGTGGVARGEVEVFPRQDAVPAEGYGNMARLPLAKKSRPLDPETLEELPLDRVQWPLSDPLPAVEREAPAPRHAVEMPADLALLQSALDAIPNSGQEELTYDEWLRIVAAIHHETRGSEDGLALAHEFSSRAAKHDGEFLDERVWPFLRSDREGGVAGMQTIIHRAAQHGWSDPTVVDEFEALPASETTEVPFVYVEMASVNESPPPARDWVVPDWLPRGTVTHFAARGGRGKSLLSQQLCTAVANGETWLGVSTVQGAVLGLFCEDDEDELRRRQQSIFAAAMIDPTTGAGRLHIVSRVGQENLLMTFGTDRAGKPTKFLRELEHECERLRPALVVIDNVSQVFAGVENDRAHVTQFVNALSGLAHQYRVAVLLVGHVAKTEGSEYSGSTAWEAAARSRWHLEFDEKSGRSILKRAKANYSGLDEMTITYAGGVFQRVDTAEANAAAWTAARERVLESLDRYTGRQQATSHSPHAANYLVKLMRDDGALGDLTAEVCRRALIELIDEQLVETNAQLGWRNASRHPARGLRRGSCGAVPESVEQPQRSARGLRRGGSLPLGRTTPPHAPVEEGGAPRSRRPRRNSDVNDLV